METTIEERTYEYELNRMRKDENELQEGPTESSPKSDAKPNLGVYMIVGGIAIIADLLGLIPLLGWLLSFPFVCALTLWKICTHQTKKSPLGKIIANIAVKSNPISGFVPSNMLFVIASYVEHTKLEK